MPISPFQVFEYGMAGIVPVLVLIAGWYAIVVFLDREID